MNETPNPMSAAPKDGTRIKLLVPGQDSDDRVCGGVWSAAGGWSIYVADEDGATGVAYLIAEHGPKAWGAMDEGA